MAKRNYKRILIDVRGGTGKNAALANVLPEVKDKYETVSVISPYTDIFEACPYVDKVYPPNDVRSAFEDAEDDTYIAVDHIYDTNEFIRKEENYSDAFRKLCLLESKHEDTSSTVSNLEPSKRFPHLVGIKDNIINDLKQKGYEDFIIVQFTGGQSPLVQVPGVKDEKTGNVVPDWTKVQYNGQNSGLSRHYPFGKAQEFINIFRDKHPNTAVLNFGLPNEYKFENVENYTVPYLTYILLSQEPTFKGIVGIDSSLQHFMAGRCKGVILWHHSEPQAFGYGCFKNLVAKCHRDGIKYFSALGPANNRVDYIDPDDLYKEVEEELFNVQGNDRASSGNEENQEGDKAD